jgi:uroporphyrinogen decarboxylase
MKLTVMGTVFQHVVFGLLGTERFLYLVYDDADLVAETFERWGQLVYDMYADLVDMPEVGAIWHADDVGFNTSTLVSPDMLRRHLLPWLRRYADLAHSHGKTFWLHCCGNVYDTGLINDLMDDVGVDAFHSFEDAILPVADFQTQYGHRLAAMGGVDMDALVRLDKPELRRYMRDILDRCMPGGRYIFGSGNTIANYVPLRNYLIMLDEARRWPAR